MASIDPKKFVQALENHVGINNQIFNVRQHSLAITNPDKYYDAYNKALVQVKTDMETFSNNLLKEGIAAQAANGWPDDYIRERAAEMASNMYAQKMQDLRMQFPDIEIAASQLKANKKRVVGVKAATKEKETSYKPRTAPKTTRKPRKTAAKKTTKKRKAK